MAELGGSGGESGFGAAGHGRARVTFIATGHPVDTDDRRIWLTGGPIDVAETVWIGACATILPGVTIGRDSAVAAGAVVADDVPAPTLVTGAKATARRDR